MSKRHKFVLTSLLLALGFMGITFLANENRLIGISVLSVISLIFFAWTEHEGMGKDATVLTLFIPPLFTFGVGLFWFLLPSTFYARLPVIALYGVGMYAMALTSNIFIVSVQKKIALARAARGVSFVLTLFTAFLLYDAVLSLRDQLWQNILFVGLVSVPLFLHGLWVSKLTKHVSRKMIIYSTAFSYAVAMGAMMLYFWPVSVVVGSLFLTVAVYVLLGLGQAKLEGRLFKQTMYEYLTVGVAVFILMVLFTSWKG